MFHHTLTSLWAPNYSSRSFRRSKNQQSSSISLNRSCSTSMSQIANYLLNTWRSGKPTITESKRRRLSCLLKLLMLMGCQGWHLMLLTLLSGQKPWLVSKQGLNLVRLCANLAPQGTLKMAKQSRCLKFNVCKLPCMFLKLPFQALKNCTRIQLILLTDTEVGEYRSKLRSFMRNDWGALPEWRTQN